MSFIHFFKGTTVLITGASAGFGEEYARQLAPHAKKIILIARRLERLDALKADLTSKYAALEVATFAVDLADESSRNSFCDTLLKEGTVIDLLINNAGLGDHGRFETSDLGKVEQMLKVNVIALTSLTHRVLPLMVKNGSGAILNVSSFASVFPIPFLAVYAATKAYVSSFSEALRAELRGTGISVTAVCPGPVDTEFRSVANRKGEKKIPAPDYLKISSQQVVWQSLQAVSQDRARVFPGLVVAVIAIITSLIPIFILRHFLGLYGKKK